MPKQTAVEWLIDKLMFMEYDLRQIPLTIEQAKEMEQEQIIDAFNEGNQSDWNNEIGDGGQQYYNETFKGAQMDNIDKFIIALKDLIIEYKGNNPNYIANEISNRIACYKMSDRETSNFEQIGVLYHFYTMLDVLNNIDKK
jgi:hypothetical protein